MKLTTIHATLFTLSSSLALAASATQATIATYDAAYDDATLSLSTVTCSNGENGLVTKGYNSIGDLPTPYVAGSLTIKGWNDANCGACYSLSYKNETVYVVAIDVAIGKFNAAQRVLDKLTQGHAEEFGSVLVDYEEVDGSKCGF
ncbi:hypothetical protein TMatcc_010720 [Talaromyces marneffei ATCC 18224]|uniref:Heat-stable 19 kDa antigen, putative n=2 Tax=Talaromyces marneffei TaxID=37727 RepID=B6QUS7_TALMQ|nr:uncharacterized protein EYB26_009518 [Talaromyces marneffei]EEA18738.1 heat-stable 19 kDa antigen precursor, putative [Talaromyces marneffei ATCC 18224]KAE8548462.1 hypothetical protein EYB25_008840 [Talaromyces marneffei]QGA21807.1 hypothetical protein EYB26_009518 [Talaromyces marneffei]